MPRKYKIILYILGFFVALAVFYMVISGISSSVSSPSGGQQTASSTQGVPPPLTLTLSPDEESSLKEFVKNFVTLYNNYSYDDFSNLTALGDYENQAMQEKTQNLITQLQSSLQPGYSQSSKPDASTFSYQTSNTQTFTVSINVDITETNNSQSQLSIRSSQEPQSRTNVDTLTVVRYGQSWLVGDIQIK
jgi:hypothetical protein